jgi:hypothetical protein
LLDGAAEMAEHERMAFAQFLVSTLIGCAVYAAMYPDLGEINPKAPLIAGLFFGFVGGWLVMFIYVWLRYGWKAAKSLKLDGN